MDRLFKDNPAEFVRRLTGASGLRELFEASVIQERDPEKHRARVEAERTKRELHELRQHVEHVKRDEMSSRQWSELSATVADFQQRSERPKPAPKPAAKPIAPAVAKKKPKKQPDTNAARALVQRFRQFQKTGK